MNLQDTVLEMMYIIVYFSKDDNDVKMTYLPGRMSKSKPVYLKYLQTFRHKLASN